MTTLPSDDGSAEALGVVPPALSSSGPQAVAVSARTATAAVAASTPEGMRRTRLPRRAVSVGRMGRIW
ncbi:hypothetical protein SMICM17S_09230 [Streptomyces microflavus]